MTTSIQKNPKRTDRYGIKHVHADEPSAIDRLHERWAWSDHVMRIQGRYSEQGGNPFIAATTYFSVPPIFLLIIVVFATLALVLRGNGRLLEQVQPVITDFIDGSMGGTINTIIEGAIDQVGGVFTAGFIATLRPGLGWIGSPSNTVVQLWKCSLGTNNFVIGKVRDLLRLLSILVMVVLTFAVAAVDSSGLTRPPLNKVGLVDIPGITITVGLITIVVSLLANWLLFLWMLTFLPHGGTSLCSAAKGVTISVVGSEAAKQPGSIFFPSALSDPVGVVFGSVIGLMVVFHLIWRITMYATVWIAATEGALTDEKLDAPVLTVIDIRVEAVNPTRLNRLLDSK